MYRGLTGLAALLGLVGIAGIAGTLALSIVDRRRELGLLRAVGMQRRQVRSMVRADSVIVGLVGAALGIALGLAFGWAAAEVFTHSSQPTIFTVPLVAAVESEPQPGFDHPAVETDSLCLCSGPHAEHIDVRRVDHRVHLSHLRRPGCLSVQTAESTSRDVRFPKSPRKGRHAGRTQAAHLGGRNCESTG